MTDTENTVETPAQPAEHNKSAYSKDQSRAAGPTGKAIHVVEFLLGNEHYAVNLTDVREVVEYTAITPLPNAPAAVQGIIDLRGEITTILDLRQRLNIALQEKIVKETSRIMVLDEKLTRVKTGVLVDDVLAVSMFEQKDIDTNKEGGNWGDPAILGTIRRKTKEQDREKTDLIIWIDIRQLTQSLDKNAKKCN
ncbi:MAG: chemotaxis protein CheW [Methanoregula sp.]|nr:chemotaxis protein CheW [Methanoregula sp.]